MQSRRGFIVYIATLTLHSYFFSINIFVPMTDEVMKFVCKPLALRRTLSSFFSSSICFTEQLIGCKDRHGNKDGKDLPERRERGANPAKCSSGETSSVIWLDQVASGQFPHLCLDFNNFYNSLIISRLQKPVKSHRVNFLMLGP